MSFALSNVEEIYGVFSFFSKRNMPANSNVASPTSSSLTTRVSTLNKPLIYHRDHPMTPVFTALGFEFFYLVYGLIALLSQYVNIYQMVCIIFVFRFYVDFCLHCVREFKQFLWKAFESNAMCLFVQKLKNVHFVHIVPHIITCNCKLISQAFVILKCLILY